MFAFLHTREASLVWQVQRVSACLAFPGIVTLYPTILALACLPLCVHVWIGIGEVIEDYVHGAGLQAFSLLCTRCVVLKAAKVLLVLCML